MSNYHQGIIIDSNAIALGIQHEVFYFLESSNQCSALSQSSIDQFVVTVVNLFGLYGKQFVSGKQIEEEKEQEFVQLIREMYHSRREVVSLCFPDYISTDNKEKIRNEEQLKLNMLKTALESVLLSRDPGMVRGMLPYFEEGGAFAAVGFSHLNGVLEGLKAQGYEVRPIAFSTPLMDGF